MTAETVGIGILGFGGFGLFAVQQFAQVPGAGSVHGRHAPASVAGRAARFGVENVEHAEALLASRTSTSSTSPPRRSSTTRRRWPPCRPAST